MRLHLLPRAAALALITSSTVLAASNDDILQVSLVFPRNTTYPPAEWFPIVLAIDNPSLAQTLPPHIETILFDHNNHNANGSDWIPPDEHYHNPAWLNLTDPNLPNPFLVHKFYHNRFNQSGHFALRWKLSWTSCNESAPEGATVYYKGGVVEFSVGDGKPSRSVDLVAATRDNGKEGGGGGCDANQLGAAVRVTGDTRRVLTGLPGGDDTCAVPPEEGTATTKADPCGVKVDEAAAESLAAVVDGLARDDKAWRCTLSDAGRLDPPEEDCPEEGDNAAGRAGVAGVVGLAAAVGALGFVLM